MHTGLGDSNYFRVSICMWLLFTPTKWINRKGFIISPPGFSPGSVRNVLKQHLDFCDVKTVSTENIIGLNLISVFLYTDLIKRQTNVFWFWPFMGFVDSKNNIQYTIFVSFKFMLLKGQFSENSGTCLHIDASAFLKLHSGVLTDVKVLTSKGQLALIFPCDCSSLTFKVSVYSQLQVS